MKILHGVHADLQSKIAGLICSNLKLMIDAFYSWPCKGLRNLGVQRNSRTSPEFHMPTGNSSFKK